MNLPMILTPLPWEARSKKGNHRRAATRIS